MWLLLTWSVTVESLLVGLVVSVLGALLLVPLGFPAGPWWFLAPRRLLALLRLAAGTATDVFRANLRLVYQIWTPRMPIRTGIVIVPTRFSDVDRVAATGLLSSLVVDNQVIDVDLKRRELLYHCIVVPAAGHRYETINGPLEGRIERVTNAD
ncbi:hypothetical protein GCM10009804_16580 [Kribbella hippodromi]|uniref:Na+/H+ antiporter subunit E n=1 Tax=Kribbella hippodromi TaxID=434347 RepID=A0ABP4NHD8_9ACTN